MHIAFLFPRFKLLSGAERLILKLAGALIDSGVQISLICHRFDPSCEPIRPPQAQLLKSGKKLDYFSNRYVNAAFDYFRTDTLVDTVPIDVNAVCCFGPGLTAVPEVKKRGLPAFYFCYEPPRFLYTDRELIQSRMGAARYFSSPVFKQYKKRDEKLVHTANVVFSNSEFGRRQIKEIYDVDATVVTHGLDPYQEGKMRADIRKKFGILEDEVIAITVNYLHPRKRIDLFIETIQNARQTNPKLHGLIVGDGPERQQLEQLAQPGIHFAGFVSSEQLHEYYQSADIYLHTAHLETFGLSVIEASGNKLPVVSVNEGGPCETVKDWETGYLLDASAPDLANAVLQLANDRTLRRRFGQNGFEYVRSRYSWEQGARDFMKGITAEMQK